MCGSLRRAARVVTQYYAKVLGPSGLEPTQFTLLVACARAGPVPVTVLAEAIAMDRTTLARNLKPLVRRGLAIVSEGADRRVRRVELSKDGRTALSAALPLWRKAQSGMAEILGQARLDGLLNGLGAVVSLRRAGRAI
jgi:DNA-binding MarR family transcriptional regulator